MTYNIHSGFGRDKRYELDRIIQVIKHEDPDIIALQEVDNNLSRSNFQNQSEIIAGSLEMNYHHCVNHSFENGEYGLTTLSRFPMVNIQRYDLSFHRYEPRGSLRTDLLIDDRTRLHVFNVHLGLRIRERQHQRRRLLSESMLLNRDLQDPVLVLGDFNDRPFSVIHEQLRDHFVDVCDLIGPKFPPTFRRGPIRLRLDHIYASSHFRSLMGYVVNTPLAQIASDHFPVVALIAPVLD